MFRIFKNETTNATSEALSSFNGQHTVACWGTFGGATVKLQLSLDGTKWFDIDDLTFTDEGIVNAYLGKDVKVRGVISGGSSASLNLSVA